VNTLAAWIEGHPGVNVLMFESNYDKSFGFGEFEEVCGFCLASYYFEDEPPKNCKFCRAPIQETHIISDLPDIRSRVYRGIGSPLLRPATTARKLPFIVKHETKTGE